MEDIILKYLLNEMTIEDQHRLMKWLAEGESNVEVFKRVEAFWTSDPSGTEAIKNEIWDQKISREIAHRFDKRSASSGHGSDKRVRSASPGIVRKVLKIAAVLFIAFSLSIYVIDYMGGQEEPIVEQVRYLEKISLNGQKINIQLPDGSKVKLNAGSRLIAPDKFVGKTREVELVGEGYFEVERNEEHPFIVKTRGLNVTVLGTSFNVRAYTDEQDVRVAVNTGKVAVENQERKTNVLLLPTEMAVYNPHDGQTVKTSYDYKEVFSWKDKVLYFNQANMDEILNTLEKWYGVEFEVEKSIDKRKDFSGEYENKSLEVVLDGLSYVFDFKYKIIEDKVIIS